jgi:formate dehydrogenase subunit delta
MVFGSWPVVVGRWSLVVGRWSLVVGRWSNNSNVKIVLSLATPNLRFLREQSDRRIYTMRRRFFAYAQNDKGGKETNSLGGLGLRS